MSVAARIELTQGDITREDVDAIVNAANGRLAHGGGVAGAISRAAGPDLQRACDRLIADRGALGTGEAVATDAFLLPCHKVIHAVGPIYGRHKGQEASLLGTAHRSAIALAADLGLRTLAFPAISCGIYGYPLEEAAPIAIAATADALAAAPGIERVRFCFIGRREYEVFDRALKATVAAGKDR
ncbi:MAG: macro domain-containing protein [Solirubrobacterales bacterium]